MPANGVLYAGDLNAIQDAVPAASDFTQNIRVRSIIIGEDGLQLYWYGPGEAALSGDLRIFGILRALGGMLAGAFNTAQRGAIASTRAPKSLIIYDSDNDQYLYNKGSDASRNWQPLGGIQSQVIGGVVHLIGFPPGIAKNVVRTLADGSVVWDPGHHADDHVPGGPDPINYLQVHREGTLAAIPSPIARGGTFYFATDDHGGRLYKSDGANWKSVSPGKGDLGTTYITTPTSPGPAFVGALPGSPADGTEVYYNLGSGLVWHLRYNAGASSPYKWEVIGATPLYATFGFTTAEANATIFVPHAGDYDVEINTYASGAGDNHVVVNLIKDNAAIKGVTGQGNSSQGFSQTVSIKERVNGVATMVSANVSGNLSGGTNTLIQGVTIFARPIRVG